MKICISCKKTKSLDDFYKHPQMGDGHLNKCKDCCKAQAKSRAEKLSKDPEWKEKEKARGREKYRRLGYKDIYPNDPDRSKKWRKRYPEKYRAYKISQRLLKPGMHKHHWSYREGFEMDVFFFTEEDHNTIHRFMIYDQEQAMYRKLDGVLIDSKESAEEFYKSILAGVVQSDGPLIRHP